MSKSQAAEITAGWQSMGADEFSRLVHTWPETIESGLDEDDRRLRKELLLVYAKAKEAVKDNPKYSKKADYYTDLFFASMLYERLYRFGFSPRLASNDEIWIYLSIRIVPDIVYERYPGSFAKTDDGLRKLNVNEERYWKTRRRIYLKVLWWYIYLSLQNGTSFEEQLNNTIKVLMRNTTDEIVQIVERSGKEGYRVNVYRTIMTYYSKLTDVNRADILRKVMVLNTARATYIEPALCADGVNGYVKELFHYFGK